MNDRHRTRERWRKKHAKSQELNDILNSIVPAVKEAIDFMMRRIKESIIIAGKAIYEIKAMPEEEYQKVLVEHPEITPEQIAILTKLRSDVNHGDNGSESMGR